MVLAHRSYGSVRAVRGRGSMSERDENAVAQLKVRLPEYLRARLEAAAPTTLNAEVVRRLEQSFRDEETAKLKSSVVEQTIYTVLGGTHNAGFMFWLSRILSSLDEQLGKKWVEAGDEVSQFKTTLGDLMRAYQSEYRRQLADVLQNYNPGQHDLGKVDGQAGAADPVGGPTEGAENAGPVWKAKRA